MTKPSPPPRRKASTKRRSSAEIAAEYLLPEGGADGVVPVSDSRSDDEDLDSGSVVLQETYAQLGKRQARTAPAAPVAPVPAAGRRRSGRH